MASVRQEQVAIQSSAVTACAGLTRNALALRGPCALTLTSGAPDAWEWHDLLMEEQGRR